MTDSPGNPRAWMAAAERYRAALEAKRKADAACDEADNNVLLSDRSAEAVAAQRNAHEVWEASLEAIDAAFKIAAEFPVSDLVTLAAKFELLTANLDEDRDWERQVLITAFGGDLRRISGREA